MSTEIPVKIKLTPIQNKVIYCLQNGYVLITDTTVTGAWVGNNEGQFHIDNGVFYRLINKGLICQQLDWPFYYVLSKLGKEIKTVKQ